MITLLSVIFALVGTALSRSDWNTINIKSKAGETYEEWAPYKATNKESDMSFSYFTINHTDTKYLNGTITLKMKNNGWAVPLSNDPNRVRLCIAFFNKTAQDAYDSLG